MVRKKTDEDIQKEYQEQEDEAFDKEWASKFHIDVANLEEAITTNPSYFSLYSSQLARAFKAHALNELIEKKQEKRIKIAKASAHLRIKRNHPKATIADLGAMVEIDEEVLDAEERLYEIKKETIELKERVNYLEGDVRSSRQRGKMLESLAPVYIGEERMKSRFSRTDYEKEED